MLDYIFALAALGFVLLWAFGEIRAERRAAGLKNQILEGEKKIAEKEAEELSTASADSVVGFLNRLRSNKDR